MDRIKFPGARYAVKAIHYLASRFERNAVRR